MCVCVFAITHLCGTNKNAEIVAAETHTLLSKSMCDWIIRRPKDDAVIEWVFGCYNIHSQCVCVCVCVCVCALLRCMHCVGSSQVLDRELKVKAKPCSHTSV